MSRRVPEAAVHQGLQVVRGHCDAGDGARGHRSGGSKRKRQVQRRRCHRVGARRPGSELRAVPEDGRRHLRRHRHAGRPGSGGGLPDHRQLVWTAAGRVRRGDHRPHAVPERGQRVLDERRTLSAAGHPGGALRRRCRSPAARHHLPGPDRRRPERPPRGTADDHRGRRRNPEVPASQGEGPATPAVHRGQPGPVVGPPARGAPTGPTPGATGRRGSSPR